MPGRKAPSARGNPGPVGVGGRRNKASRGARRQQRRRQPEKNRTMLALADGETRLRGEQGANKGAVSRGKSGSCWRWRTGNKASRGARRQHGRRQLGKIWTLLALADGETRLPEERGANMPCRATLIHAAFGKAEEIDDEPLFAEASSSISSRPPGELE